MKRLLLLLCILPVGHVSLAQTNTKPSSGNTPAKTATTKQPAAPVKPASQASKPAAKPVQTTSKSTTQATTKPAATNTGGITANTGNGYTRSKVQVWRTPEMQEAMDRYIALQYEAAYEKFKEAAAQGEAPAYYFMGRMHQHGEIKRKATAADSLTILNPDLLYVVNKDSAKAYFELALEGSSLLGNLGMAELMIISNDDEMQQFLRLMRSAAVDIREKAVEGDPFCNRILGSMYYTGYGEMKDHEYAFNYLSKAAAAGDVKSYVALANLYLSGEGVAKDPQKAVQWLQKGAAAGEREALYTLGLVYEEGLADSTNTSKAKTLYYEAIGKGSRNAFEQLKYVNQTADQKLVIASFTRNFDQLKRALAAGANINTRAVPEGYDQDFRSRTPLMHAVYIPILLEDFGVIYEPNVRVEAVSFLIRNNAEVNATDQDGRTALHYAMLGARINTEGFEKEQAALLDTLLHYGADPNIVDKKGNAPLYYAIRFTNGQHEMELSRLLNGGTNTNIQNEEGKTALMLACQLNASNEVVIALLRAGANPRLRDNDGKAAIDYAKNEAVVNILMAAGSPEARK